VKRKKKFSKSDVMGLNPFPPGVLSVRYSSEQERRERLRRLIESKPMRGG
jgi:hypothetical protein